MSSLRVRINEGGDKQPILLWDSVWQPWLGKADWAIAGADEDQNRGGLQSKAALHTAVIISFFTDKRIPDGHPLLYLVQDGDRRGWFGDGEDIRPELGETEMGSYFWVLERAPLTEEIRRWTEAIAIEALAPLVFQRAVARIEVQAIAEFAINRCDLAVQLYGRDGTKLYDFRFDDLWRQLVTAPPPLPFPQKPL
ncbi:MULTISPECIES: phage GP46 family protein [unclassified Bradyrhizobium]|uniref:phage GP46 family protein n=1 Tax=unclassified Bradyrhizobium TaxID=2631580 RepID=UPI0028E19BB7|nr:MULTISPECIES: phage GP46 family protein [unclassified Bradyrhizobium]